ncbi:hypothetical protein H9P43_000524 [Blastocladiella emersonii ATCC 22665]|nr:hypothetical protein H9P43_000524 [Blastocladiella emersonii ATCC 22665]
MAPDLSTRRAQPTPKPLDKPAATRRRFFVDLDAADADGSSTAPAALDPHLAPDWPIVSPVNPSPSPPPPAASYASVVKGMPGPPSRSARAAAAPPQPCNTDASLAAFLAADDTGPIPGALLFRPAAEEMSERGRSRTARAPLRRDRNGFTEDSIFFDPDLVDDGNGGSGGPLSPGDDAFFSQAAAAEDKNSIFDLPPSAWSVAPSAATPPPKPPARKEEESAARPKLTGIFYASDPEDDEKGAGSSSSTFDSDFFSTGSSPTPAPAPASSSSLRPPPGAGPLKTKNSIFDAPPSPVLPASARANAAAAPSLTLSSSSSSSDSGRRSQSPSKHLMPSCSPILIPYYRDEPPPLALRDTSVSISHGSLWTWRPMHSPGGTTRHRSPTVTGGADPSLSTSPTRDGAPARPYRRRRSSRDDSVRDPRLLHHHGASGTGASASATSIRPGAMVNPAAAVREPVDPQSFILHFVPLKKNLLGIGLHAHVYRGTYHARAGAPERACAVKVLHETAESQRCGLREAALLARCMHPNIVDLVEVLDVANHPWPAGGADAPRAEDGWERVSLANLRFPPDEALLESSIVATSDRARANWAAAEAAAAAAQRRGSTGCLLDPATPADDHAQPHRVAASTDNLSTTTGTVETYATPRSPEYVLVLELCEGGCLWKYVRSHPLGIGRRQWMRWARQLAQAVEHMHTQRVVHHDIKPQNILLDEFHGIKLSDFGGAEKVPRQGFFEDGVGKGTLAYMAPELVNSLPYHASVDIYSLGATLYVIGILGHEPFQGCTSPVQLLMAVGRGFWKWPTNYPDPNLHSRVADAFEEPDTRAVNPGMHLRRGVPHPHAPSRFVRFLNGDLVDAPIWNLLQRCLDADPENRPTAAELVRELRGLDGLDVVDAEL